VTPERWQQISRLYHAVVHCDVDQRAELLDQACAGDAALRRELESLLSAGAEIDGPLLGRSVLSKLDVGDRSDSGSGGTVVLALAAGTHVGPYEIRSLLGRGGMGEVYRATDTRLRREVAIKLLRGASVDPGRLDRFEREARAAAALNHPNIVTTYDVGSSHAGPYVVSELLEAKRSASESPAARAYPCVPSSTMGSKSRMDLPPRTFVASCTAISNRRTCSSPARAN